MTGHRPTKHIEVGIVWSEKKNMRSKHNEIKNSLPILRKYIKLYLYFI